jgi:hypothetical protein
MKKNVFILLLAVMMVTFFSCKKDSSDNNTDDTTASFSLKFQGTTWTGSTFAATHLTVNNTTQISAYKSGTSDQIVLAFSGSGTGTYTFNDNNMGSAVVGTLTCSSLFSDTPVGSIVITKYDDSKKLISGTFSFDGQSLYGTVYHITDGKFVNIPLIIN